ncbi:ferredoxin [Microbacterium hydrocarbonoxydans]|uniref:ferredoxin n=1 Tax=Microbacterium hydrocarbonoxydans TaxID=273678 RepID=UPI003D99D0F6
MALTLTLDLHACQGYANCLIEGPALFDFDEDTDKAVVLIAEPGENLRSQAVAAQHGCPARAIHVTES